MHSNPAYSHVTVVSIGYLISILILTTNGLLLLGLLCDRLSRQSTFGLYVINMCIANFLYGCLTIVQYLPSNVASSMGLNHDTCVYIAATLELLPAVTVLTLLVLLVSELHFLLSGGYEVMKENTRLRCIFGLIGVWFTWILATLVVMPLRMNDTPPPLTPSRALPGHGVTYFGGGHPGLLRSEVIDNSVHSNLLDASDDRFSEFVGKGVKEVEAARFTGTYVSDDNYELATNAGNTLHRTQETPMQRRSTVGTTTTREAQKLDKAKFRSSRSVPQNGVDTPSHRHDVDIEEEVLKAFAYGYSPSKGADSSPQRNNQPSRDARTQIDDHKHSISRPEDARAGGEAKNTGYIADRDTGHSTAWNAAEASGGVWQEAGGGVGLCSSSLLPSHPRKAAVSLVTVFPPTLALLSLSLALLALLFCSQGAGHPKHAPPRRPHGNRSVLRWSRLRDDVKREIIVLVVVCIVSVALRMPREVARLVESIASGGGVAEGGGAGAGGGEGQWQAMPPYLVLLEMLNSSHAVAQPILWLTLLPAAKRAVRGLCCRGSHAPSRDQSPRAFPMETSV